MIRSILTLFLFAICFSSLAQQKRDTLQLRTVLGDSIVQSSDLRIKTDTADAYSLITVSYAYQMPGGDMAKRFKNNSSLGAGFLRKTRFNILVGFDFHFMMGGNPKENTVLSSILTSNGEIIDDNGMVADIRMYERGYEFGVKGGKLFSMKSINPNSGFFGTMGIGFMQHKIRIESIGNNASQLTKEYKEGYDRMTNGLMLAQTLGFMYMGEKRLTNVYLAIEVIEGFTQGRRYNFDQMKLDNAKRMDLLYGIRFGWMIPLQSKEPEEFYFF